MDAIGREILALRASERLTSAEVAETLGMGEISGQWPISPGLEATQG